MPVLFEPDILKTNVFCPNATLLSPVVFDNKDCNPIALLPVPVVLLNNDE